MHFPPTAANPRTHSVHRPSILVRLAPIWPLRSGRWRPIGAQDLSIHTKLYTVWQTPNPMKTRGRAAPTPAEMGAVDIGCKAWVTGKGVQLSKSNKLRATTLVARRRSCKSKRSSARLACDSSTVRGPAP